jgi:hypothetical protein
LTKWISTIENITVVKGIIILTKGITTTIKGVIIILTKGIVIVIK